MNKLCHAYGILMGTILGEIFCTFHKDGFILGRNFLYISVKWVHFSGKNVCTLGHKFVPEPSITSKIHREPLPPPGIYVKRPPPFETQKYVCHCSAPVFRDRLSYETTFYQSLEWSLKTGFTVYCIWPS